MPSFDYEYTEFIRHPNVRLFVVDIAHCHAHIHKELELCLVLSGAVEASVDGNSMTFGQGECMLFNSRQIHEVYASACESALLLTLQISPTFCIQFFPEIDNVSFDTLDVTRTLSPEKTVQLKHLLCSLSEHFFRVEPYHPFYCVADTSLILCLLLENIPWHHISEAEKTDMQIAGNRLNRIVSYIEEHYTDRLLLSDIAKSENLSLGYLSHFFRQHFTLSFQQYVSKLRFEKARRLLMRTDMSLTGVCVASGFPDCRQMRKVFLELASCAPEDYRGKLPHERGLYITRPLNSVERELDDLEGLRLVRKFLV